MKLDHLTFGQLYKLQLPETLMRVITAYHKALRRQWREHPDLRQDEEFSVLRAKDNFPELATPWQRVIKFLRGQELKTALRKSADAQEITPTPAAFGTLCTLEARRFPNFQARCALMSLIMRFCSHHHIVAFGKNTSDANADWTVVADTGPLGCKALLYKSGLPWDYINDVCGLFGVDPMNVFFWLQTAELKETTRVNPLVWPTNTPDIYEFGKTVAHNDCVEAAS